MVKLTVDYYTSDEVIGGVQAFFNDFKRIYPEFRNISFLKSMFALYGRYVRLKTESVSEFDKSVMISEYLDRYEKLFSPDVIVKNSIVSTFKKHKSPMICTLQDNNIVGPRFLYKKGYYDIMAYNRLKGFLTLQKSTAKRADAIVASSMHLKDCYEKEFGTDIELIKNGVDTNMFKPNPNKDEIKKKHGIPLDRKIGITTTGFHPIKGWHIQAKLCHDFPDVFWIAIFKDDTEKPKLKNVRIFNKLPREQLPELYSMSDFFILPSAIEGCNISALEAMSCGLPSIMSNSGYFWNPEAKGDYEVSDFGFRVNKWDYGCYKRAVEDLLSGEHSFEPRKHVEDNGLDMNTWVSSWRKLIEKVISEKK